MSSSTVISLDAMGGDHGPSVVVGGADAALRRRGGENLRFLLHGDRSAIEAELARKPALAALCEVVHTDTVIAMDAKPAVAVRRGKGTSLWNAISAVKTGEAKAVVSAGNTGALMALSKLILRMSAPGLDRPAIACSWPGVRGVSTVLDVGANVSSDAAQLVEFAIMGEAFHRALHGVARPTIGLLNVGSEDMKGHEEVREAARLLRDGGLPLSYHGFVEGDDLSKNTTDVVVTDGFTGNIALKTAEGTARFVSAALKDALTGGLQAKIGALIAMPALRTLSRRLDPGAVNGGPLLGLNGLVVKSHGGADAKGYASAIVVAANLARSSYIEDIARSMDSLETALAEAEARASTKAAEVAAEESQ